MKDYYQALGVDEQAGESEIKKAYRKLAKQYHPDTNPSEKAHDRFIAIAEAYSVLSDPEKRSMYDRRRAGFGSSDTLQRMSEAFAKAQAAARAQAEAEYRRRREAAEARAAEERRWGTFADITARIGLVLTIILLIDFFGASWSAPATILQKRLSADNEYDELITAERAYRIKYGETAGIISGWKVTEKMTPILSQSLSIEAFPPYEGSRFVTRYLSTGASLYRPFVFFPFLMVVCTLGALFRKGIRTPVHGLQFAIGVWTFLALSLLVLGLTSGAFK